MSSYLLALLFTMSFAVCAQTEPEIILDESVELEKVPTVEQERFQQWLKRITENRPDTSEKIEMLNAISNNEESAAHSAYLLYYNVESDLIGYPHLKMILDKKVFEIHRIPNKDGTFLRERELYRGLMDARKGYLPSGILKFSITGEQTKKLIEFLREKGGTSMRYAYLNKFFSKDTYNCGGILYEGLQHVGYNLPPMTRFNSMLPGQLFRNAYKNLPEAKFVGVGKSWTEEFVKPNWGIKSIPVKCTLNCDCIRRGLAKLLNE